MPTTAVYPGRIVTTTLEAWETIPGPPHPILAARATLNPRTGVWLAELMPGWEDSMRALLPPEARNGLVLTAKTEHGARLALRTLAVSVVWLVEQRDLLANAIADRVNEARDLGDQETLDLDGIG